MTFELLETRGCIPVSDGFSSTVCIECHALRNLLVHVIPPSLTLSPSFPSFPPSSLLSSVPRVSSFPPETFRSVMFSHLLSFSLDLRLEHQRSDGTAQKLHSVSLIRLPTL